MNPRLRLTAFLCSILFWLILCPHPAAGQAVSVEARVTPEAGIGPFEIEFRVTNTSADTILADVWLELARPGGETNTVFLKSNVTLPPQTVVRGKEQDMERSVFGLYTFVVNVGTYPDEVLGTDSAVYTLGKLRASDADADDYFGCSVSFSGDYAVIGAYAKDDSNDAGKGSAYIFRREGPIWTEEARLTASDGDTFDFFGWSVSISGDYAVIGTYESYYYSVPGSAYIFRREGSVWTEEAKLTPSDGTTGDDFGGSVSISGDYAIIGTYGHTGFEGAAYIFRREGSNWMEEAKLTPSDGNLDDRFGWTVSISGDYAAVGAMQGSVAGAAYIFRREGSIWMEEAKLIPSDGAAYDNFGGEVSISGDYVVVAATGDDGSRGSAYIFRREGSRWVEEAKLRASDGDEDDYFGTSVSIARDYAVIGASWDEAKSGSVYIFRREGSNWTEDAKLRAVDREALAYFGTSVSILDDGVLVGAMRDKAKSGSAYVYEGFSSKSARQLTGPEVQFSGAVQEGNITVDENGTAEVFRLSQNHPNPFNPTTEISYSVPVPSRVTLEVFNTLGQRVALLVDGVKEAGSHTVQWNGTGASGVYFYRIQGTALEDPARHFVNVKKMVYVR
jgi:hypothetical protein